MHWTVFILYNIVSLMSSRQMEEEGERGRGGGEGEREYMTWKSRGMKRRGREERREE